MANFTLTANPAADVDIRSGDIRLRSVAHQPIVCVAAPQTLDTLPLPLPAPGKASMSDTHAALWIAPDQIFVLSFDRSAAAHGDLTQKLVGAGYIADQTDGWIVLDLSGPGSIPALERLCMVDISQDAFPVGSVARTAMEHMSAIVWRKDAQSYWLLSAKSSAESFIHAVETSLIWTDDADRAI